MKNIIRYLASLMVAIMLLTAVPMSGLVGFDFDLDWFNFTTKSSALEATGKCGDNVTYTFDSSTGLLTISGTGAIYQSAFYNNSEIKTVIIEDSAISIGSNAFEGCAGLINVTIGNGVTSIGNRAFWGCTGLTSIAIPNSVKSIGDRAFGNCTGLTGVYISDIVRWCNIDFGDEYSNPLSHAHKLYLNYELVTKLTIPDSITGIGDWTFSGCTNLTTITLPNSVTSIGKGAFAHCLDLLSITIPDSVIMIGKEAFLGCYGLISAKIGSSVVIIEADAFGNCKSLKNITIPSSVISIGDWAFYGCIGLSEITIPNSVVSIGKVAFGACYGLTSLILPNSVTSIGDGAFDSCVNLTSIIVDEDNTVYDSRNNCNALIKTSTNELIVGCKNTKIPNSVTIICEGAFEGCADLTNIIIPDGITSIGDWSFYDCIGLTSIEIPDSVKSIGDDAFLNCTGLTSVTIGNHVTSIGEGAFGDCTNLISITIPYSVKRIGQFALCTGLKLQSVYIYSKDCLFNADAIACGTVYGFSGSTAETYANENGLTFVPIDNTHVHEYDNDEDTICNLCGDIRVIHHHTDGEWKITKQATFTEEGEITLYCKDCGAVLKTEKIAKLERGKVYSVDISDISMDYNEYATLTPSINADDDAQYTVKYGTSNAKVATVDDRGNVYASGTGSTIITCTVTDSYGNEVSDTCTVKVSYTWWQWAMEFFMFVFNLIFR